MKSTVIQFQDKDILGSLRSFLSQLLETKIVHAVLVPRLLPSKDGFVQSLVSDAAMLEDSNPLAPTMAVQSASILADLTSSPFGGRIAAVLKPCELRGAIELAKFLQVNPDNIMTIGVDCLGTCEVKDFAAMAEKDPELSFKVDTEGFKNGSIQADSTFRDACKLCNTPAPQNADITFGLFGNDLQNQMTLFVGERFEKELQEKLSVELTDGENEGREAAVLRTADAKTKERVEGFEDMEKLTGGLDKLQEVLAKCIRCHNCMDVCPICYCKECVFDSSVFEHRSDQFLNWAVRKGAIRVPTDTLIFHLTRMSHMATSCVSCGMCDSACPNDIPVSRLFGLVGSRVQKLFDYRPGVDPEAEPPVSAFKEEELQSQTGPE